MPPAPDGHEDAPIWARGIHEGIRAAGSRHVVYVPDDPLSHVVRLLELDPEVETTIATREDEAVGIAAGLYLGGRRPTVMMQSSGLGNAVNALASLLVPYQVPALIVLSMRGGVGEWNAAQMPMGRAVRPVLRALGLPFTVVDRAAAAADAVRQAGLTAFGTRTPAACLLPRRLTAPHAPRRGAR